MKAKFGKILVQQSDKDYGCGTVELIYNGCVICFFENSNSVDGELIPELREVYDRLLSLDFKKEDFWKALSWGRRLAEVLIKSNSE